MNNKTPIVFDFFKIAKLSGEYGIRYPTNDKMSIFLEKVFWEITQKSKGE